MQTPRLREKVLSVNVKSIFSKKDSHVYLDPHLPLVDQTSISGEDNPKKILDHRIKINSGFHTNFMPYSIIQDWTKVIKGQIPSILKNIHVLSFN